MVYFVGAGCGAADLITVRGMHMLEHADVIIYAGSLVNPELLNYANADCRIYNSAKLTLEEVIHIIRQAEQDGKMTVRLHTGDPSIYGAIREQMDELDKLGICYEACPGVSACFGAAASLHLEYTLPDVSQSFIITRMAGKTEVPPKESIESFAAHHASMAIYLSTGMLGELSRRLLVGGYGKDTPAAIVYKATWPEEEAYICTVGTLEETAAAHGITKTAVVLVGDVILHRGYQKSKLYAAGFETEYRSRKQTSMQMSIISFTKAGAALAEKTAKEMPSWQTEIFTKYKGMPSSYVKESVFEWAGAQMREKKAILFIGACGIAVRAIAPYVSDKLSDSPVLVMDEQGTYVIPVLSGHMGGANEIARLIAEKILAEPVITTATDLNGCFAVDLFAKKNGLFIENREGIAKVSAKVLDKKVITVSIDGAHLVSEKMPDFIRMAPYPPNGPVDIVITSGKMPADAGIILRPKEYAIGIGCKRGKGISELDAFIGHYLKKLGISHTQIFALASIDQKSREPALMSWAKKKKVSFYTYTPEELNAVKGAFHDSAFVEHTVGVANVCERAALSACKTGGRLVLEKQAKDGMTIAVAKREWSVDFDEF